MTREQAETFITEHLRPVFGFALKRCAGVADAEDLSQEILLRVYRTLLLREDIDDPERFLWTAAHNALANYYRDRARQGIGADVDALADLLPGEDDVAVAVEQKETADRLQKEIAYLSRIQRRTVIAYYYENKKQSEIAAELGIPVGTVKWHLFEAKKELKRGIQTVRTNSELKFNPIRFSLCGTSGSIGTKGNCGSFFRSALSQNIAYVTRRSPKTVAEIADALGVSPVYVESEAEYLEEYGFLTKRGEKYLCNILLEEPTAEINRLHDEMYTCAAEMFANGLYDALMASDIWEADGLLGGYEPEPALNKGPKQDKNFLLWALIPYVTARSGESMMEKTISFEEAATLRPDGGHNICYAEVENPDVPPVKYADSMRRWYGPCWNEVNGLMLWQIDSEWSARRVDEQYSLAVRRDLALLAHWMEDPAVLSAGEYAELTQRGYVSVAGEVGKSFRVSPRFVWIRDEATDKQLLAIGDAVRKKVREAMETLKAPYVRAVLADLPTQMHSMMKHNMQYVYYSDGWFILHCMKTLVENGKLQLPREDQRQSLTTVIVGEK